MKSLEIELICNDFTLCKLAANLVKLITNTNDKQSY